VLGQPEAVGCLVERIALVKAGLTDPTRPLGVFLFVGPTGTGKTEIAKALAEFLFGGTNRLVRLDMSEFQTPDSLDRLLADSSVDSQAAALISSVRSDPFSVVLLDEFEKAALPIRDLFLQVFDDGRLTDQRGRLVDFRRCVIILTSNVGSAIARGGGVGFATTPEKFRPDKVEEAVRKSFRPEFLNRIDRVVVFRPFQREQMRGLLDKELTDVLARRGLRGRPWALEVDQSAYDLIIERGFSAELGARPLKRAVERYLLVPLAEAIVGHSIPEGDQFLFVSAPGSEHIEVAFIDPDAEEPVGESEDEDERGVDRTSATGLDLRDLTLSPRTDQDASRFLLDELRRISTTIRSPELEERKEAALSAINAAGFWDRDDRFAVLAETEYLDRLQAALATAESLGDRFSRQTHANGRASDLAGLLSGRLYVLDRAIDGLSAGAPTDVFVLIRRSSEAEPEAGAAFVELLANMYLGWAERRGMRVQQLAADPAELVLAVSGLGSGAILGDENGLHVLERGEKREQGGQNVERVTAIVCVARWEPGPEPGRGGLLEQARTAVAQTAVTGTIVRRYRAKPAPLVRDAARRYRTGRLDRVLAGDFDLY
jgi:ATP-dependent Clp protease ATP-binding subunit ClpC